MAKSKVEFQVTGMTCEGCVRSIEHKLSNVKGVTYAHVNLGGGIVTVEYDDELAQVPAMVGGLKQIGFEATQV